MVASEDDVQLLQQDTSIESSPSFWGLWTARRRRHNVRKMKMKEICFVAIFIISFRLVQVAQMGKESTTISIPTTMGGEVGGGGGGGRQHLILKDNQGREVSRNSFNISSYLNSELSFLDDTNDRNILNVSREDAISGREPLLAILEDAGFTNPTVPEIMALPKWEQVTELYGNDGPIILGLDTCQEFQRRVPERDRFIGVAGNFNSGTTAFALSLQHNCYYPNRGSGSKNYSNDALTDVNGMLSQVPWAKHKQAYLRTIHSIQPDIPIEHVLPIIMIRDPYFWMASMCKQGYGVRWDHNPTKHCPNLVPNEFDRKRFRKLRNASSVMVWQGKNPTVGLSWNSLVHFWNDWHGSYVTPKVTYPHLLIRFEDTLFRRKELLRQVCKCGGAQLSSQFTYLVDEAKWNHKHAQNNFVSAMVKYGSDTLRYRNMTNDDIAFAERFLDPRLMQAFHYRSHKTQIQDKNKINK